MELLRSRRLDVTLVLLVLALLGSAVLEGHRELRYGSAVTAVAVIALLGRAWRPPAVVVLVFVVEVLGMRVAPQATPLMFVALLATFGVTGTLAPRGAALAGWVVGLVALGGAMLSNPYVGGAPDIALTLTFCTIVWVAGLLVTEHGRQASVALDRAELVESRRDLDVAEATAHERARIAGDLHDIVSHGLSVVILQTVAARMALEDAGSLDPAIDRRLASVEETARDGLADMRRLLDVIGHDAEGPDAVPPSGLGLAELPALIDRARAAGLAVDAAITGDGPALTGGLDAVVYRIVQEALTNVLRHAPGADARVWVDRDSRRLTVEVRNGPGRGRPADVHGAGHGLVGMRQRAELYGGRLVAGADADGYLVAVDFDLAHVS